MYLTDYDRVSTVSQCAEQEASRFRSKKILVTNLNIGERERIRMTKGGAKGGFRCELDVQHLKGIRHTIFVSSWVTNHEVDLVNSSLDVWSQVTLGKALAVKRVACNNDFRIFLRSSSC